MGIVGLVMIGMLLLGFPFVVTLLAPLLVYFRVELPTLNPQVIIQQLINGFSPPSLIAVPMFILAANIMTSGKAANRLVEMIRVFVGHIPGGLAITTNASCTLFGAVSGSTQATVSAIGGTMRPMLLKAGYSSSFTLGLIINASDIALLIPPSIGFIVYGVVNSVSIGRLFLAGIGPGILIFLLFSIYVFFYSKIKNIAILEKATWGERKKAIREGFPVLGFPILVIGGIYGGIFSPTEAAAVGVAYGLVLELVLYRTLTWKKMVKVLLDAGIVTGVVFILVGAGQVFSWMISFLRIPQQVMPAIIGTDPTQLQLIIIVVIAYFVACMFVDPIVAIYVLSPIFQPYVAMTGIDPVLLGTLVVLQAAVGSATPPFGCDIFTAQLIFRRPYFEVIRKIGPFIALLVLSTILIIAIPGIALWIPNMAGI
ncbi:MAG: TRAP transporter large permease [Sphaerochaetaceae bacterium]|nr:TRAP transporter large permease [Sphaerochaetaceae bacterium]MDX9939043.1 TRAP transporter large permease [Sphaerochaetaceae bacterium]